MILNSDNAEHVFSYHPPTVLQRTQHMAIRDAALVFAKAILANTPACADQQAALRKVREAMMTANAAISLEGLI